MVDAIQRGDKRAFRIIFESYYNQLLRFAYRYVYIESAAEGVVQDVFLWIWENRKTWNVEGKLKTYLFRAVKHRAIDHWRWKSTHDKYVEQYAEILNTRWTKPEEVREEKEEEFILAARKAIEELPEKSRLVYKLNRLEGLTYREIAEVLEVSPKTVESHMSKALRILRKQLSNFLHILSFLIFFGNYFFKP